MQTKNHFRLLFVSLLFIGGTATLTAQTVKVPGGNVGNSNNQNVGINVNNPEAKLDVQTDPITGGLLLRTSAGETFTGYESTPYALQVLHTYPDIEGNPQTSTTVKLLPSGGLTLGNVSNPTRFLNLPQQGLGVYNGSHGISLTYGNTPGLPQPALNWTGTQNFAIAFNTQKVLQFTQTNKCLLVQTWLLQITSCV
jgi:hypothetical protein